MLLEEYIKEAFENKNNLEENEYKKQDIKNEIKKHIISEDNDSIKCDKISNSLIQSRIEYYHDGNTFNKYRYFSYQFIWDSYRSDNLISPQNPIWINIFQLIYYLIDKDDSRYSDESLDRQMNRREDKIVEIVYGPTIGRYHFKIVDGEVLIENGKAEKVVRDIEDIIKLIGSFIVIDVIFKLLNENKYEKKIGRYLLPKQFYQMYKEVNVHFPINYLLNLCIKNIHIIPKKRLSDEKNNKKLLKLEKLISEFVYLFDTQKFSYMSDGILKRVDDASFIHNYILYDHFFRFSQISRKKRRYILDSLLKTTNTKKIQEKLGFSLDEYKATVNKIYELEGNGIIHIPKKFLSDKELLIMESISHKNEININYTLPSSFNKVKNPYFLRPIIKFNKEFFLLDKCYSAWNFYEVILDKLNYKYIDIGTNIEESIKTYLKENDFTIHYGKYLGSERECDIVVEEPDHILFIEVKKKTITRNSVSGGLTDIIIDLIDMFVHSQEQALAHETFIKKHDEIKFRNGTTLSLSNREISTISISLFDSYTLNDRSLCIKIMEFILKLRLEIKDDHKKDDDIDRIKKSLQEKNSKIEKLNNYLLELCGKDEKEYRKKTFNIGFLSLELLLFFIDESIKNKKSLSSIISSIKNVSFSTGEVYSEYYNVDRIKNTV